MECEPATRGPADMNMNMNMNMDMNMKEEQLISKLLGDQASDLNNYCISNYDSSSSSKMTRALCKISRRVSAQQVAICVQLLQLLSCHRAVGWKRKRMCERVSVERSRDCFARARRLLGGLRQRERERQRRGG